MFQVVDNKISKKKKKCLPRQKLKIPPPQISKIVRTPLPTQLFEK